MTDAERMAKIIELAEDMPVLINLNLCVPLGRTDIVSYPKNLRGIIANCTTYFNKEDEIPITPRRDVNLDG